MLVQRGQGQSPHLGSRSRVVLFSSELVNVTILSGLTEQEGAAEVSWRPFWIIKQLKPNSTAFSFTDVWQKLSVLK